MSRLFARLYDWALLPQELTFLRALRRRAAGRASGRVLEIGIGTGLNLPHYGNAGHIIGMDPHPDMLAQAKARAQGLGRRLDLVQARAEELPFASSVFDAVVGSYVFCTIPEPRQALDEVRRVARPQAPLRLIEHVRWRQPLWGAVQDLLTPVWERLADGCQLNRDTLSMVRTAGYRVEGVRSLFGGLILEIEARS